MASNGERPHIFSVELSDQCTLDFVALDTPGELLVVMSRHGGIATRSTARVPYDKAEEVAKFILSRVFKRQSPDKQG